MTPTRTLDVTLINGMPYVRCPQCDGSGDNGVPPFCDECFGSGQAPLGASAIRAAKLGEDLDVHVEAYRTQFAGGRSGTAATSNTNANKYAGKCIKCRGQVAAGAGWTARDGNKWCIQHRIGECLVAETPAPAANVRTNRFASKCANCGEQVAAETGKLSGKPGAWVTEHLVCPEVVTEIIVQSSVTPTPTAELVARLEAVLDYVPAANREFATSMVAQFGRKGYLSPKQLPYAEKYTTAGEEARNEDVLRPVTEDILARAAVTKRASLRFAITSGGANDLDFLCVYRGRVERHMGAVGGIRKQNLAVNVSVTLANRIMELSDADFVKAQHIYGEAMAECGKCGSSLSDLTSRARGFGPDCWEHVEGEYTVGNTEDLVAAYKLAHPDWQEVQAPAEPRRSWPTGLFADPCRSECD